MNTLTNPAAPMKAYINTENGIQSQVCRPPHAPGAPNHPARPDKNTEQTGGVTSSQTSENSDPATALHLQSARSHDRQTPRAHQRSVCTPQDFNVSSISRLVSSY